VRSSGSLPFHAKDCQALSLVPLILCALNPTYDPATSFSQREISRRASHDSGWDEEGGKEVQSGPGGNMPINHPPDFSPLAPQISSAVGKMKAGLVAGINQKLAGRKDQLRRSIYRSE